MLYVSVSITLLTLEILPHLKMGKNLTFEKSFLQNVAKWKNNI